MFNSHVNLVFHIKPPGVGHVWEGTATPRASDADAARCSRPLHWAARHCLWSSCAGTPTAAAHAPQGEYHQRTPSEAHGWHGPWGAAAPTQKELKLERGGMPCGGHFAHHTRRSEFICRSNRWSSKLVQVLLLLLSLLLLLLLLLSLLLLLLIIWGSAISISGVVSSCNK